MAPKIDIPTVKEVDQLSDALQQWLASQNVSDVHASSTMVETISRLMVKNSRDLSYLAVGTGVVVDMLHSCVLRNWKKGDKR